MSFNIISDKSGTRLFQELEFCYKNCEIRTVVVVSDVVGVLNTKIMCRALVLINDVSIFPKREKKTDLTRLLSKCLGKHCSSDEWNIAQIMPTSHRQTLALWRTVNFWQSSRRILVVSVQLPLKTVTQLLIDNLISRDDFSCCFFKVHAVSTLCNPITLPNAIIS